MESMHYFPGSNTESGFSGFFDEIFDTERFNKLFILKGAAGTGKSSLMKKVAADAAEMGLRVDYYHCASDPKSLDGIIVHEAKLAVLDGTAPHVLDPQLPACADGIINLAEGLNEAALATQRNEIRELCSIIASRFRAASAMARAAQSVKQAIRATYITDECGISRALHELRSSLLSGGKSSASYTNVFHSALTPEGIITCEPPEDVSYLRIKIPWGLDITPHMTQLAATNFSSHIIIGHDPLCASAILSLAFENNLCIVTASGQDAASCRLDLTPFVKQTEYVEGMKVEFQSLVSSAVCLLRCAREQHDLLEKIHINAMDFSVCEKAHARIMTTIKGLVAQH